jgi:hypothetical protein
MTMFQLKANGKWRDIALPFGDLKMIEAQVRRYGTKPDSQEMKFLADLVRENFSGTFDQSNHYEPAGSYLGESFLTLDEFVVMVNRNDTLKLGLLWERRTHTGWKGERKEWTESDGFVEVTILPAN